MELRFLRQSLFYFFWWFSPGPGLKGQALELGPLYVQFGHFKRLLEEILGGLLYGAGSRVSRGFWPARAHFGHFDFLSKRIKNDRFLEAVFGHF